MEAKAEAGAQAETEACALRGTICCPEKGSPKAVFNGAWEYPIAVN